jgi:hypothetical protein
MNFDGIQVWPALIIGLVLGWMIASKKKTGTWF